MDFSVLLLISNRSLIAYDLKSIFSVVGQSDDVARLRPQKLSGARDVNLFAIGLMKDRTLIFYQNCEGTSSTFKVLEAIFRDLTASPRSRRSTLGIRQRSTEFFREYDDFYVPSETYAINLFRSSIAIATERGLQILALDKKVPFSIPDLTSSDVMPIAQRIRDLRPLGMFRLSDSEFLLVYDEVAVYINKHGDISRSVVMEFVGKVGQACLVDTPLNTVHLILINTEESFVQVRNAMDGRLEQVISGKSIRLLDDGASGSGGKVMIRMQHPLDESLQLVLEMVFDQDFMDPLTEGIIPPDHAGHLRSVAREEED